MACQKLFCKKPSSSQKPRYKFRGPYKKHPKPPRPYKDLYEVCEKIADFFPIWLTSSKDRKIDFWGIRLWQRIYPHERNKAKIRCTKEAEIIGSENFPIEERLKLHQTLLKFLEEGRDLATSLKIINRRMNSIPIEKERGFITWLKQLRG